MRILTSLIAATLVATSGISPVWAQSPFAGKKFVYRAEGKKLPDLLQDFAASQSMPIVVDAGVEGVVNADFNTKPEDFLNALSRTYGIIWYFDGTTLFVYPSRAMQSKVFRMRGYDRQQVRQMLSSLNLGDPRFPLRFDDSAQTLLAYGPPRHIELVTTVLEQLERGSHDSVGKSIKVFPLRFASAGDRQFGNSKVPGLVSTLNSLFTNGASGSGAGGNPRGVVNSVMGRGDGGNKAKSAQGNFGMSLDSQTNRREAEMRATPLEAADPAQSGESERPYFQADESTNSVIVRGQPDRMNEYGALIAQLDVAQDLVEIEASIIDISSDEFESLGVDWDLVRNGANRLSVSGGSPAANTGGSAVESVTGTNITTVIGNAGQQLLARIRALEGKGKANILSRPKVLGAVNRMASMVDKRVASVRVAGNLDANLFTVEAGTTLQVTPQIVIYPDHRNVRLSLSIQDGNFEGTVVDSVPIVKQTEINTEATIREGESLLIGGISIESDGLSRTGVPWFSKIPVFGAAFRHTEGKKFRSERLFLITPKVISFNNGNVRPYVPTVPAVQPAPVLPPVAPIAPPSEVPVQVMPSSSTYRAPAVYGQVGSMRAAPAGLASPVPAPRVVPSRPVVAATEARQSSAACAALGLSSAQCGREGDR